MPLFKNHFSMMAMTMAVLLLAITLPAAIPDLVRADEYDLSYVDSAQWTYNQDCAAAGDTLCTAMINGIQLWDVSDPGAAEMLSDFYADGSQAWALDRLGDVVVFSTDSGELIVMDVSDPEFPAKLAEIGGVGPFADVFLRMRQDTLFAYSAGRTSFGLQIHDLSDPSSPVLRGSVNVSGLTSVTCAGANGDTLLTCSLGANLYAVDISSPDAPQLLSAQSLGGEAYKVTADGGLAVVAAKEAGCHILDISDPSSPLLITTLSPTINPDYSDLTIKEVLLDGSRLVALAETAGPLVYELSPDPATPVLTAYDHSLDAGLPYPYNSFRGAALEGDRLYASHFNGRRAGALIYNLAETDLIPLGRTTANDFIRFAAADGEHVFTCLGEMGVSAHHYSEAEGLTTLGNYVVTEAWGVEARGDTAYVASTADGLVIIDFGDPGNPQVLGSVDMGQARGIQLHGDIAYVTAFTQGLHTIDLSDPSAPVILDSETWPGMEGIRLSVQDGLAATADRMGGLNLWDVSDPSDVIHMGNYDVGARIVDVVLHGDLAYVTVHETGIHILDISDPSAPLYLDIFEEEATGCVIDGDFLIASAGFYGVATYDIGDPLAPEFLAAYNTPSEALAVCIDGGHQVFISDRAGLSALRWDFPTAVDDGQVLGPVASLGNYPNPFNPRTNIRLDLPAAGDFELAIYDVRGRRIKVLHDGPLPAGTQNLTWQALDANGHELPSGVYLLRLSGRHSDGSETGATHKLTLLR